MKKNNLSGIVIMSVLVAFPFVAHTGATAQMAAKSASSVGARGKTLVAYFTCPEQDGVDASSGASRAVSDGGLYGNTEYVARLIADGTGGDLFAIETEKKYPASHKALIDEAKREADVGERPKLKTHIKNLQDYDVIFVGYPNWWYDNADGDLFFLRRIRFQGKNHSAFVTHGGSRFSQSVQNIAALEKEAAVIEGPSVSRNNILSAKAGIRTWLDNHGFLKKQ